MALLFTALLLLLAALVGTGTVRKMIEVYEAKHELKQGSAGFFRMIRGWSRIGFWLLITWFLASVMGDWHRTDDLGGAIDRAQLRLYVMMEILAALAESDN
ncbi:hypothetical protein [Ponticoccus alexandrii]|uniref:Uncharacterized protein n=1 Tax=Ponticoccus alexandrii TaxID=1943633 RepID=A0ABX7F8E2_9RHOB|nr:hypothetical protein [Ponticoccus alexandrii]ETA51614.1 hypothetical protein P279_13160 [Rhodobacteraceae bacterium PD-2]QRF66658.1 hypothetical protein GQA70_10260 [Ponticoccus alexandrii]